ncbi:MAG: gamma-glutamylcyclotransferase family protein [Mariprofundaceae bacterium]
MADPGRPSLLYFAYGSNMHPARMIKRAANARLLGLAHVNGYALCFDKRGMDDSAKCNVKPTDDASNAVHGVVYAVTGQGRKRLDEAEGGYRAGELNVQLQGDECRCFTYQAKAEWVDDGLSPFDWYRGYVLDGAVAHGLPLHYIQKIRDVAVVADPDAERRARHFLCLQELSSQN